MSISPQEIISLMNNPSEDDKKLIIKAFDFAQKAHEGQKRYSGEDYFIHPFVTAKILAQFHLGAPTIAAGLLHDVWEDCIIKTIENPESTNIQREKAEINEKELKNNFSEEIIFLVNGVTKLGTLKYQGIEWKVENLRKMFLAMAKDIRVVLIKLADRLHNMRTLEHVPEKKQERIALETLEIYAPIANRLGMGKIKGELEDLAFKYVYPEDYKKVLGMHTAEREEKEKRLEEIKNNIKKELHKAELAKFQISSRIKFLYSLYKKLQKPNINMEMDKVYDLIAIRIIVKNVEDCYKTLGIIHTIWKPFPGRIKDYIAVPKPNGYQSLHTTVFADNGEIIEIQIRTEGMHEESEYGIAAHWAYKESNKPEEGGEKSRHLNWVNQLVEWQKNAESSKDFLETLRIDFFQDRVFCFTPKGDVIDLPEGATAIDFAYAIHTSIGNNACGAMINDKYSSLDTILKNNDVIEIRIQKDKKPKLEWASKAKTSLAKRNIKAASKGDGFFERFKIGR